MARLAMAILLLVACGCGSSGPPKFLVQGSVKLDGEPLETGLVNFIPSDGKGGIAGAVIERGRYSANVPPGTKRVEITSPKVIGRKAAYDTPDSPMMDILEERVPTKFNASSGLTAEVSAQQATFDFDLSSSDS